jgi:hypothetical protein
MFPERHFNHGLLGLFLTVLIAGARAGSQQTNARGTQTAYSLPGSPNECYLMNETSGRVIKDTCGYGDGVISGDHYALSPQGVTWEAGGSQIRTSATIMPRSVLACFTHVFGGTEKIILHGRIKARLTRLKENHAT